MENRSESEKLDRQIIVGRAGMEIMHPQADLGRREGRRSHTQRKKAEATDEEQPR